MIKLYTHHCARRGLPRFDERFRHVPQQFSNFLYEVYHCNPRVKLMPTYLPSLNFAPPSPILPDALTACNVSPLLFWQYCSFASYVVLQCFVVFLTFTAALLLFLAWKDRCSESIGMLQPQVHKILHWNFALSRGYGRNKISFYSELGLMNYRHVSCTHKSCQFVVVIKILISFSS